MVVVIEIQQSKQMEEIFAEFNFRLRLFFMRFHFRGSLENLQNLPKLDPTKISCHTVLCRKM